MLLIADEGANAALWIDHIALVAEGLEDGLAHLEEGAQLTLVLGHMWVFARARAKLSPSTPDYGQTVGSELPSLTTVALVQTRYGFMPSFTPVPPAAGKGPRMTPQTNRASPGELGLA